MTRDGKKYRCGHPGCAITWTEEENHDEACRYHEGTPVFHDTQKYWTCCTKPTYDWDDF